MFAFAWASGLIQFGHTVPAGALEIAAGSPRTLRTKVAAVARLAYDNESLLVPGIPEADPAEEKLAALARFRKRSTK